MGQREFMNLISALKLIIEFHKIKGSSDRHMGWDYILMVSSKTT